MCLVFTSLTLPGICLKTAGWQPTYQDYPASPTLLGKEAKLKTQNQKNKPTTKHQTKTSKKTAKNHKFLLIVIRWRLLAVCLQWKENKRVGQLFKKINHLSSEKLFNRWIYFRCYFTCNIFLLLRHFCLKFLLLTAMLTH